MRTRASGPFVLPVRDIIRKPGEMREFDITAPASSQWGEGLVSVADKDPIDVDARVEAVHEGMYVSGTIDATATGQCGRCLTDIELPVEVEFQELFEYPGSDASDYEIQDDHVDLEGLVRDAIVLSLPFQPVCRPDCPGLDPTTGERLTADSGSEQHEPVDPRWAALQAFKEGSESDNSGSQTEES